MHVHLSKGRRDAELVGKSRQFSLVVENNSTKTYHNQVLIQLYSLRLLSYYVKRNGSF